MDGKNILKHIKERFSPLIFTGVPISSEQVETLLLAASWSASSYNSQPWKFIYEHKGTEGYNILHSLLSEYNQQWTADASVLMLGIARYIDDKNRENYFALYDLGQAVSAMAIQASAMGLQIHQMGGYDMELARKTLFIPQHFQLGAMIAIGYPDNISKLQEPFLSRATAERTRKNLSEIAGNVNLFKEVI